MESALPAERWLPKSVLCLREYNFNKLVHDVLAGITVGLVALPLAMAFSIASGLTPQAGIYCAIVTGFLVSALGGSKTQIGGPTGASVVVVRLLGSPDALWPGSSSVREAGTPLVILGGEQTPSAELMELSTVPIGIAAQAHAPFVSAAAPDLFNLESYTSLDAPRDLAKIFDSTE